MGYFQKQAYHDEQAKKYNINKDDFTSSTGGDRWENFDEGGYKKAIKNAQRNDFDYRTSAQHMDGVKGNAKMGDFTEYQRAAVKLHKQAGNGGEYSSNKDITGVTNNLVNDANKFMMNKIDALSADQQQKQAESGSAEPPSEQLQEARDTVDEFDNKEYNIYDANTPDGGQKDQQKEASQSFLDNYKLNLANKQKA